MTRKVSAVCILLVEDELDIREIVAEYLRDASFEIVEAENGNKAHDIIQGLPNAFTILITDLHMPGTMDGSQLAVATRSILPNLPIVIATGRPDKLQPSLQSDLVYTLFKKPYLPSQLLRLIRTLV